MLSTSEQKTILARFIDEQIAARDWDVVQSTRTPLTSPDGEPIDLLAENRKMDRTFSVVFGLVALCGPIRNLDDAQKAQLRMEGYSDEEITEIACELYEWGPAYANFGPDFNDPKKSAIGPDYAYFVAQLEAMNVVVSADTIEYARRLWFRGQSDVLYPVHPTRRNALGEIMRKLSVTVLRNSAHFLGTSTRRKCSVASANSPRVSWHLLCVTFLCMTPQSRSIGFRCGQ